MSGPYDVLVLGGGVVGLAAALGMANQKQRVAIIDAGSLKVSRAEPDLRVYAVNQASEKLLRQLGAWDFIDQQALSAYRQMYVWDGLSQDAIEFDSRLVASNQLGMIIEEAVIKESLLKAIAENQNIELFPNQKVEEVMVEPEVVLKAAESEWQGRLLIIADGARSPAREQLKVELTQWPYNSHAVVASVQTELPHQQTAWQVFNEDGPLAFLPLKDAHQCSIVWSTRPARAGHLVEVDEASFNQQLTEAFANKLGKVSLISQRHQFPLTMRQAKQYSGKNWLLMGDAAHTIHPLAGLGLNVGLADVGYWLDLSAGLKDKEQLTKALGRYQRARKAEVWKVILLMESLKRLFTTPLPPLKWLRGKGLSLTNQLGPIKRLLIGQAMGS